MRSVFVLFRWEYRRILSNWRQTLAIFLVPSLVLLLALYLFPVLVNYLSTGNVGRASVVLVSPDENMLSFIKSDAYAVTYTYKIWSADMYSDAIMDNSAAGITSGGGIIAVFHSSVSLPPDAIPGSVQPDDGTQAAAGEASFPEAVDSYFTSLSAGTGEAATTAVISIYSDSSIIMSQTIAYQFEQDVLPRYKDYLIKTAGSSFYSEGGGAPFLIDNFNPYTKLMEYRSQANSMGARVIPGILILLLYYCVYSLSGDILASDRDRGFLSKLILTPLSTRGLLWGKALAVIGISALTSVITLLVLVISSWANRSNNPLSLIPFGLLLSPAQFGLIMASILCAASVMTMICFKVIVDLKDMQDITLNLQLPLLLFLVDFFLQLFRVSPAYLAEYFIPVHNNLLLIHDIMAGTADITRYAIIFAVDFLTAALLYRNITRTFEMDSGKTNKRGKNRRRVL